MPSVDEIADELEAGDSADTGDSGDSADSADDRRYPSTIGGAFYLVVLAVAAAGIGVAWSGDWRLGVRLLAGGLCAASATRLVLPSRDAGMLAVRHRLTDCLLLGGVGAALFFLAGTIPDQPV